MSILESILKAADVENPIAMDVALALDCSGSMDDEFADGTVAAILTRIQTFAKFIDNDGKLETIGFSDVATGINTLTADEDVAAFVKKNYDAGGTTAYAEAIEKLLKKLDHDLPSIVFVVTDGDNNADDKPKTLSVLEQAAQKHPTKYIHFVRAGKQAVQVKFIEDVANKFSNVGYSDFPEIKADDETFFKSLVTKELIAFLKSVAPQAQAA